MLRYHKTKFRAARFLGCDLKEKNQTEKDGCTERKPQTIYAQKLYMHVGDFKEPSRKQHATNSTRERNWYMLNVW